MADAASASSSSPSWSGPSLRHLRAFIVGACYTDVILQCEAFPKEDSKMRAQSVERRRGGNGGNILCVLSQFGMRPQGAAVDVSCEMVCVFAGDPPPPGLQAAGVATIPSSTAYSSSNLSSQQQQQPSRMVPPPLGGTPSASSTNLVQTDSIILADLLGPGRPNVSLRHCIFRGQGYSEPTAWIIATPTSRTVVNHTTVPEMTCAEFDEVVLEAEGGIRATVADPSQDIWVHCEGRNVAEVEKMINRLIDVRAKSGRVGVNSWNGMRRRSGSTPAGASADGGLTVGMRKLSASSASGETDALPDPLGPALTISVEFEKTNRPGLDDLLPLADVLFFSKVYAEGKGFPGAPTGFLDNIRRQCKNGAILYVTWGEHGVFGLVNDLTRPARTFHVPAPSIFVVDTIGAGDTFAAGVIYALGARRCDAESAAGWACRLATSKCSQVGFEGLQMRCPFDIS